MCVHINCLVAHSLVMPSLIFALTNSKFSLLLYASNELKPELESPKPRGSRPEFGARLITRSDAKISNTNELHTQNVPSVGSIKPE